MPWPQSPRHTCPFHSGIPNIASIKAKLNIAVATGVIGQFRGCAKQQVINKSKLNIGNPALRSCILLPEHVYMLHTPPSKHPVVCPLCAGSHSKADRRCSNPSCPKGGNLKPVLNCCVVSPAHCANCEENHSARYWDCPARPTP